MAVKPRLSFSLIQKIQDSTITYEQIVENKGLGPAIVKTGIIGYNGKEFPLDFDQFIQSNFPDIEKYADLRRMASIPDYSTIAPNEVYSIYILDIEKSKYEAATKYVEFETSNLEPSWDFKMEYTSMYEDEVWEIDDEENIPKQQ